MSETALRGRWTDRYLDDLNQVVDEKVEQLDGSTRAIRADIRQLHREMTRNFGRLNTVGVTRSYTAREEAARVEFERRTTKTELWPGGRWTDGRIDDLRRTVADALTGFSGEIQACRREIEWLRSELNAGFAALDRRRRFCRRSVPWVGARQHYRPSSYAAPVNQPPSDGWTDGRLDDFNHSVVDVGFVRLERDVSEVQGEVKDLRSEMEKRFDAYRDARWDRQIKVVTGLFCVPRLPCSRPPF